MKCRRENACISQKCNAPFFCPADGGQAAECQGYCRKQEKADTVAGQLLETHGEEISRSGARRKCQRNRTGAYSAETVQGSGTSEPSAGQAHAASVRSEYVFNAKGKAAEIEALLEDYIPGVEKMQTKLKKYDGVYKELKAENAKLEKDSRVSVKYRMDMAEQMQELEDLKKAVDHIPPEILQAYQSGSNHVHHSRKEKSL